MSQRALLPACWMPYVDHWRSLDEARNVTTPLVVLHGDADNIIPPSHSLGFEALPNVTRLVSAGAAHNDIGAFPEYGRAIENFIAALSTPD